MLLSFSDAIQNHILGDMATTSKVQCGQGNVLCPISWIIHLQNMMKDKGTEYITCVSYPPLLCLESTIAILGPLRVPANSSEEGRPALQRA